MTKIPPKVDLVNRPDYRQLIGDAAWQRLHPAIRKRFSSACSKRSVTYKGVMEEIYLSRMGKLLAHCCRIIGTPLVLYSGKNVPH